MKELGFINICIDLLRISLSDLELEKVIDNFLIFHKETKLVR